jgi:hypothetical protein
MFFEWIIVLFLCGATRSPRSDTPLPRSAASMRSQPAATAQSFHALEYTQSAQKVK